VSIHRLILANKIEVGSLIGIAVGICALVGPSNEVISTNGKYEDAVGFSFEKWARNEFNVYCAVENDTRLALLGEQYAGAARGFADAVLVTLGTGIGGAAMIGGKLLRSSGARAGSLAGHLGVDWRGRMCSCGNRGCAEAEASSSSLDSILQDSPDFETSLLASEPTPILFQQLFQAADRGDPLAVRTVERCISVWSALCVSLLHAYDPQVLLLGGGVMKRKDQILPALQNHIDQFAWVGKGSVRVTVSELGDDAALMGAIPLLLDYGRQLEVKR
jgi:glucokinase